METKYVEVSLVRDVRNCKECKWFHGCIPPYGNFPLYDWNEDYPKEISTQEQTTKRVYAPLLKGNACGQGQVDAGIMHGCRKAPIMTIGINPNMTAYFVGNKAATWCYPSFREDKRYAYYYRYHNVYQESFDLDFIKKHITKGTEIVATDDGWVEKVQRCSDHRWVLLTIRYKKSEKPVEIEVAWTPELRFVLLVDTKYDPEKPPVFKKGDVIGAKIGSISAEDVQIYKNSTGYYQRFVYVLDAFKEIVGGDMSNAPLSISEDVAQHDMVSCASPGWNSKYDIPQERIAYNCVTDKEFLTKQLYQSKPAVIVIVGGSSLIMFATIFGDKIKGLDTAEETFKLLKETTEREYFLEIDEKDVKFKSRIILSPHFSYSDNFVRHSRFSSMAWQAFKSDFPNDYKVLQTDEAAEFRGKPRIIEDPKTFAATVLITGVDDKIKAKLSSPAWNVIMAYYFDPIKMIANALKQEYDLGRIKYDKSSNRLARADGPCHFCNNELWQFPERCPYDMDK